VKAGAGEGVCSGTKGESSDGVDVAAAGEETGMKGGSRFDGDAGETVASGSAGTR